MLEINSILLDNGIEYFILDNIDINGVIYTLFSNVDDDKDIKIRKVVTENDVKYYDSIYDEEELKNVISQFNNKINS